MNRAHLRFPALFPLLLIGLLVSTSLAGQRGRAANTQSSIKPTRIGAVGKKLTDQEVANLIKVLPAGGTPWLISGDDPGPFPTQLQKFQVYMPPISATAELRHGVAIQVNRPLGAPSAWSIAKNQEGQPESFDYAQVAIAGRPFDQIQDENGPNRPFILSRASDDAELVSLVTYVRSLYQSSPVSAVTMVPDPFTLQIGWMKPGEVSVTLRKTSTSGVVLNLRKLGQSWEVSEPGVSIVVSQ